MNNTTCMELSTSYNNSWCPAIFDGFLCWPATPPGHNATMPCPEKKGVITGATAYRHCGEIGIWDRKRDENDTAKGFTNYENCLLPQLLDIIKMCEEIKECPQITRTTRNIEMVGLSFSFISLIISLIIFFQYRVLKNNRTKIHKNLFIATLLQVVFRLIKYVDQELKAGDRIIENTPILDETCITLLEYTKTAMFMWMFIEGLYLHNVITVTVFQEYSYIKLYFYIGWTAPAIMTAVWVCTMKMVQSNWGFYYFLPYYWILEGPRSTIIVVNLLFLINIIRVLIVKLRESRTSEIEQVRKAVRAAILLLPLMGIANILFWMGYRFTQTWQLALWSYTSYFLNTFQGFFVATLYCFLNGKAVRAAIFLLPLMGIANILFWMGYRFTEAWQLALWSYTSYFLNTFQGFFVAILYCFLNGEVQTAVKNSFYLHMSLRNCDYTPCRNLTLISTAPDPDQNIAKDGSNWIRYCLHQSKKSPEEKENSVRDLNDRRNSTIVTALTMVETKLLTSESVGTAPKISKDETDTTIIEEKNLEKYVTDVDNSGQKFNKNLEDSWDELEKIILGQDIETD